MPLLEEVGVWGSCAPWGDLLLHRKLMPPLCPVQEGGCAPLGLRAELMIAHRSPFPEVSSQPCLV